MASDTAASEPLRVIVPPGRSYGIIDTNREEASMTITSFERTSDTAAVEGDIALVEQALDHMKRVTIPPAYTEYIGDRLMAVIRRQEAAA